MTMMMVVTGKGLDAHKVVVREKVILRSRSQEAEVEEQ